MEGARKKERLRDWPGEKRDRGSRGQKERGVKRIARGSSKMERVRLKEGPREKRDQEDCPGDHSG